MCLLAQCLGVSVTLLLSRCLVARLCVLVSKKLAVKLEGAGPGRAHGAPTRARARAHVS